MTPREWITVAAATVRVLRDSNRIEDIHLVSDITSRRRFRQVLDRELARGEGSAVWRDRPEIAPGTVDLDSMRELAADTLGGAYVRHLDENKLSLYTDPTSHRYVDDEEVRYAIHRYRQTHDIWHVLLGLGTKGHEEVLVHAFSWGSLRLPISGLIVAFGSLKHIVLEGRWDTLRHDLLGAYRSGRDAAPLLLVGWEELWERPLVEVRDRFHIRPISSPAAQ